MLRTKQMQKQKWLFTIVLHLLSVRLRSTNTGVLSTPQFVTKLLVDGKEYYSNSKEVFNKASKDKEIDIEIIETTLFGKKYMVHFNYIDKYK